LKTIVFRCDSSSTIGLGHIKRCLVLAKRLKEQNQNLKIIFATQNLDGNINHEILENNFGLYILKDKTNTNINQVIDDLIPNLLIIDSYEINHLLEQELKEKYKNLKILSFDDTLQQHSVDMILNHGIHAKKKHYKDLVTSNCKKICGSKYTLLRDEFFIKHNTKCVKHSIAIILGGNDALNLSLKMVDLLYKIDTTYKITVITSSVNKNLHYLQKQTNIELLIDIDNIATILSSKEFIITGSGGTLFEVLALKKKFINIEVASNQNLITKFLEDNKIKTTIKSNDLDLENLKTKMKYINKNDIYKKLNLEFSKDKLAQKILKELNI